MYEELFKTAKTDLEAFERLQKIIEILRAPGGCPWDRAQTHESLTRGMVEEAYEVVQAIENQDRDNLIEELGDVLLQVVMHAQIATEAGNFGIRDICNREADKMISRHPHVFGPKLENSKDSAGLSVDNVLDLWENIKEVEKSETSTTASMQKIPRHLPALLRSEKVQKKAARVGFDWPDVSGAFQKLDEESAELKEAYGQGDQAHIREELGDLLFAITNISRFLGIDPEDALNATSNKFIRRFAYVESAAKVLGRRLEDMTLSEMDTLWEEAKTKL
jgi:tetrapyrrole methylase family protein/MazG family protein